MPVKIIRLHFAELWNNEYPQFVNQLITIVNKHNPDGLHLTKSYERVTALVPQLAKVKAQELSNALSNKLSELDAERDSVIKFIWDQGKSFARLSIPSLVPHVEVFRRFLNMHGKDIALANYNSETSRVKDMLADYDAKPEVKAAVEALNLTMFFEQLRSVNTTFDELFMQRTEDYATEEEVDNRAIRSDCDKQMVAFFDAIEYCSKEYDELDYQPLTNEINTHVEYYKTLLKARTTRRMAGKETSVEVPITQQ
ncbi:MAG: hypothetical protein GZ091_05275 [Paludibacter sp.]|nr:hypothetical protein [Paludibacter sp.]